MLVATVNQSVPLSILSGDGNTGLYAQAYIYDSSGGLVTTVALPHVAIGLYQNNYTPSTEGYFQVVYKFFSDAGFTIDAGYYSQAETLDVNSVKTNILRILGLLHENSVVDQQSYDSNGMLTYARIRTYNSSTNAAAASAVSPDAYSTGLLFTWQVNASYSGENLEKYSIIRVP